MTIGMVIYWLVVTGLATTISIIADWQGFATVLIGLVPSAMLVPVLFIVLATVTWRKYRRA